MMKRDFTVDDEGILAAKEFLATFCESPRPQIIVDEIVSNIVRCSGAHSFSIEGSPIGDDALRLIFTDDGKPFNPLFEVDDPNVQAKLEDRQIGGLGMFLVKKMSRAVTYEHRAGRNILTVIVSCG